MGFSESPGVMMASELLDLDKYKYFGRHERRTNMFLGPTYEGGWRGWECLKGAFYRAQKFAKSQGFPWDVFTGIFQPTWNQTLQINDMKM